MQFKIYFSHSCQISRLILNLLRANDIEPEIISYCENGLSRSEVVHLMTLLGFSRPVEIIKRQSIIYKSLGLSHKTLEDDDLINIIVQNPKLLQGPIVIKDGTSASIVKNENALLKFVQLKNA